MMKTNSVKVLAEVRTKGEIKIKEYKGLKGKSPQELAKMIGYPGEKPVFADKSKTKPRVFYILP